jgi:hypothetical protein
MITLAGGTEIAVAAVTTTAANNVFALNLTGSGCQQTGSPLAVGSGGNLTGVSGNANTWFFSHGTGFTSAGQNGMTYDPTKVASFVGSPVASAPSISSGTAVDAIFGAADKKIHRAEEAGVTPAWQDVATFVAAASGLPFSPVFDGTTIYTADDQGKVYGWLLSSGSLVAGWPQDATMPVSAPVLLQNGSLLVVRNDATVALVSPQGILRLVTLTTGFASQSPPAPAVDRRGPWGVAYAGDGAGLVAAIQLPALPVLATATIWPRPGRDSCNSRNAGSACQ